MSTDRPTFGLNSFIPNYKTKAEAFAKCLQEKLRSLSGGEEEPVEGESSRRLKEGRSEVDKNENFSFDVSAYPVDNFFVQHPDQIPYKQKLELPAPVSANGQSKLLQGRIHDKRGYSSDSEDSDDGRDENTHGLGAPKQPEVMHRRVQELLNNGTGEAEEKRNRKGRLVSGNSEDSTLDSWFSCDEPEPEDNEEELIDHFAAQIKGSPGIRNVKGRNKRRGGRREEETTNKAANVNPVVDVFRDFDLECFSPVNGDEPEEAEEVVPVNHMEEDLSLMEDYEVPYRVLRESSSTSDLENHFAFCAITSLGHVYRDREPRPLPHTLSSEGLETSSSPRNLHKILTPPPSPEVPRREIMGMPSNYVINVKRQENIESRTEHLNIEPAEEAAEDADKDGKGLRETEQENTEKATDVPNESEQRVESLHPQEMDATAKFEAPVSSNAILELVEVKEAGMTDKTTELSEETAEKEEKTKTAELHLDISEEGTNQQGSQVDSGNVELSVKADAENLVEDSSGMEDSDLKYATMVAEVGELVASVEDMVEPTTNTICSTFRRAGGMVIECPTAQQDCLEKHSIPDEVEVEKEETPTGAANIEDSRGNDEKVEDRSEESDSEKETSRQVDIIVSGTDDQSKEEQQSAMSRLEERTTIKISLLGDDDDTEDISPRMKLRRCSSLKSWKTPPGTPGRKKIVRFADALGLDLADVRTYLEAEIPKIPSSAYEDLECDLQAAAAPSVPRPQPPVPPTLVPMFQQPGGQIDFMDRVRRCNVSLENAILTDTTVFTITGCVRVKNLDFNKSVHVRYSIDGWQSFSDLQATYVPNSCDAFSDKFSFVLYAHTLKVGQQLEFAVRFDCLNQQHWDSNGGSNYVFQCLPQSASTAVFHSILDEGNEFSKFY